MFPNCGDVYSYFRFVISGFLVQVQAGKFFNRNLNTIIYNNGGIIMDKIFENTIEKRAKNYANEQCRCYKCDGIDNFTHNNCKLSLDEGCQEHRWKEMGYKQGAKDQREIDVKRMCDYICKICKNNSDDGPFECTSEEKEMCCILNIKAIRSYMEE